MRCDVMSCANDQTKSLPWGAVNGVKARWQKLLTVSALQTTAKFAASALRNLSLTPFETNMGPSDPKGKPYQGSSRIQVPERTTASFMGFPGWCVQACEHRAIVRARDRAIVRPCDRATASKDVVGCSCDFCFFL